MPKKTSKPKRKYTPEEVRDSQIRVWYEYKDATYDPDQIVNNKLRIMAFCLIRRFYVHHSTFDDLIDESWTRGLEGSRVWQRDTNFFAFMHNTMKNYLYNHYVAEGNIRFIYLDDDANNSQDAILNLIADDDEPLRILSGLQSHARLSTQMKNFLEVLKQDTDSKPYRIARSVLYDDINYHSNIQLAQHLSLNINQIVNGKKKLSRRFFEWCKLIEDDFLGYVWQQP